MDRFKKKRKKVKYRSARLPRLALGLILGIGFIIIGFVFFNPLVWRLNLRAELDQSKTASTVFDRDGATIATLYSKTRLWVPISEIPKSLQHAFVATEDSRFYQHKGIDIRGILRALYQDLKAGKKVQGGSTITQQLAKNIFFTQEKNFLRKIWEMAYAIRIEEQYSKAQILEFYLNSIYLGHGAWGVSGASEVYFGKSLHELSIDETALLAALARSPEFYSPFRNPQAALARRNVVLKLMARHGYLSKDTARGLRAKPLLVLRNPGTAFVGGYFVDYVIGILSKETGYSENYLRTAGLNIYTTMERQLQATAEDAVQLIPAGKPDQWGNIQPQGAIVAVEPRSGEIRALVGGRRFSTGQINRAVSLARQPGSAIKPFLYAAAIEAGYSPDTKVTDQPLAINVNDTIWRPQNYDNKYRGTITLRQALEESVNTISVQLVQKLGPSNVFAVAKQMGLESLVGQGEYNDRALAPLALGGLTKGLSLLELTGSYTPFANNGVFSKPYGIYRVYGQNGRLIYRGRMQQHQAILASTAATMTDMMQGVIRRGTGIRANIGIAAAGKTGTSNNNTNGWFIGYIPDLVAGVWIGNDRADQEIRVNGLVLGSGTAAEIWGRFLGTALAKPGVIPTNSPRL